MDKLRVTLLLLTICILVGWIWSIGQQAPESLPPVLKDLPDIELFQNSPAQKAVDLWDYVIDADTAKEKILFSLTAPYKPYWTGSMRIEIDQNRYISVYPEENWTGEEMVLVEANDGKHMDYDIIRVTVKPVEAGNLIQAEDEARVVRKGNWMSLSRWLRDGIGSNEIGDSLSFEFQGSHLAVTFWGKDLHSDQVYYRHPVNQQPWSVRKSYTAGKAVIKLDGEVLDRIDLSRADNRGWSEIIVSGIGPGTHRAEIIVEKGFVFVERIRFGNEPFINVLGSVVDSFGTPLADIRVRFIRENEPEFILRTALDGKIPSFCGLVEGSYSIKAEPDSAPGYFRPPDPEENLLPDSIDNVIIERGMERSFSFVLKYAGPEYRSLSIIRRPVGTIPAILRQGDELRIECRFGKKPKQFRAALRRGNSLYPLKIVSFDTGEISNGYKKGLLVEAEIPENVPPALYDLEVDLDGREDAARRAVKVITEFKKKYTIAHLSDLHIRSPKDNRTRADQLLHAAEEFNRISPEFVFLTGDITDVGSRPEYLRFIEALNEFDVPTYVVPGNHDYYSSWTRHVYEGEDEYRKYVGQPFYSFHYGEDAYAVVNTGGYTEISDTAIPGIQIDQWGWLISILEKAKEYPDRLMVMIAHWDYTQDIGEFYPSYNQFEKIFKHFPIDVYLCGHHHGNVAKKLEGTETFLIQSGSLIGGNYRLIEVDNARIVGYPTSRLKAESE